MIIVVLSRNKILFKVHQDAFCAKFAECPGFEVRKVRCYTQRQVVLASLQGHAVCPMQLVSDQTQLQYQCVHTRGCTWACYSGPGNKCATETLAGKYKTRVVMQLNVARE